jgi:membrane fusion protein (multidrug efflux system)
MVMVDGFQKLRPGVPVKPVPWQGAASGATVGASAPAAASASR